MQGGLVRRKLKILIARPRLHCMQRGKNLDRSFFHFVTMHAFDRQTDSFLLTRPPGLHSMQRGKNVESYVIQQKMFCLISKDFKTQQVNAFVSRTCRRNIKRLLKILNVNKHNYTQLFLKCLIQTRLADLFKPVDAQFFNLLQ